MSRLPSGFPSRFRRFGATFLTQALLFLLAFFCLAPCQAQSASFSNATTRLIANDNLGWGIALDASENLFVCVRNEIIEYTAASGYTSSSTVVTIQGNAFGIAVDSSENLYVADGYYNTVTEYTYSASGYSSGTALGGGFNQPYSIALDSASNIYVADTNNNAVKKIPSGCLSSSCTVTLAIGASWARGLALDSSGNLFIADYDNNAVKEVTAANLANCTSSSCTVTTLSISGLHYPAGIAVDASGNIYVPDFNDSAVKELTAASNYTNSLVISSGMYSAQSLVADNNGNVFATYFDSGLHYYLNEISTRQVALASTAVGASTPATKTLTFAITSAGTMQTPQVLTQGAPNLDFTDAGTGTCTTTLTQSTGSCTVVVNFNPKSPGTRYGAVNLLDVLGEVIATAYLSGTGTGPQAAFSPGTASVAIRSSTVIGSSAMQAPAGVAVDGLGNVYIADMGNSRVVKMTAAGVPSVLGTGSYTLAQPQGVAVDSAGNIYIADTGNNRVVEVVTAAGVVNVLDTGSYSLQLPYGVAADGAGNVYIADKGNNRVVKVTAAGTASVLSTGSYTLNQPWSVATDSGNNVYIADTGNNRVIEVTPAGTASVLNTGSTSLFRPWFVATDGVGNVYIAQMDISAVTMVNASGAVSSLGFGSTYPENPLGIAVDGAGDVYIVDTTYNQLMKDAQGTPSTFSYRATQQGDASPDNPRSLMFENIGNAALNLTGLTASTTGQATNSFPLDSSTTCTAAIPLAAGANCKIAVDFTPQTSGSLTGAVTLTDNSLNVASATQSISLSGAAYNITISPTSLSDGTINTTYPSVTFSASGGTAPYLWEVSSTGGLPSGMSLTIGGVLSGAPTVAGQFPLTVSVFDAHGYEASQNYTLTVLPVAPAISTTSLPNATVNSSYSQSIAATGTSLTWSVVSGSLPAGLSLNSANGALSGTPTAAGKSTFSIQVMDSYSQTATQSLTLTVLPIAPAITTTSLPNATVNSSYSQSIAATGTSLIWSVASGSLPAGMSLNSANGALSGAPTAAGKSTFSIQVMDSYSQTATQSLTLTVLPVAPAITTTSLPNATVNSSYSQSIAATGTSLTWSVASGSLPAGMSLNSANGALSGTPTAVGKSTFSIQVMDSYSQAATQSLTLTVLPVAPAITTTSLPNATVNSSYTQSIAATGTSLTWSVASGSLPAGLSLNSATGALSGTPTAAGKSTFSIQVMDSYSQSATQSLTLTVLPVAHAITTTSLPDAVWGASYSQSIAATGTSLTWSVASGSLPAGMSLNSANGALSGTPTATGKSAFSIQVMDSYSQTATQSLTLTVDTVTPTIASLTPATATAGGSAFTMTVKGTGFDAHSTVYWGTTALTTTYVSSTQLTAQVTAAAIATSGAYNVTATSTSGTTSSAFQFEVDTTNSTSSNQPTIATPAATVTAGSPANFVVTIPSSTSISAATCLNLPTGASCSYTASTNTVTIATATTTPKGTYAITMVFTEKVAGAATAGILLPFLLLPLWFLRRKLKFQSAWMSVCMALAILAGTVLATTGCGGDSKPTSPASNSGVVTLTVQ
jgi:sugar lactone lactonase YvrE